MCSTRRSARHHPTLLSLTSTSSIVMCLTLAHCCVASLHRPFKVFLTLWNHIIRKTLSDSVSRTMGMCVCVSVCIICGISPSSSLTFAVSLFECDVTFDFEKLGGPQKPTFAVHPSTLHLGVDETQDVFVRAYPQDAGPAEVLHCFHYYSVMSPVYLIVSSPECLACICW